MVSTAGGIVIAVVVLLVAAAVGWIVFTQLRARKLGVSFACCSLPMTLYLSCGSIRRSQAQEENRAFLTLADSVSLG